MEKTSFGFVEDGRERLIAGIREEVARKYRQHGSEVRAETEPKPAAEQMEKEIQERIAKLDKSRNLY